MHLIEKLAKDSQGATAIEYGLIAALIAVTLITSIGGIGSSLNDTFSKTSTGLAAG